MLKDGVLSLVEIFIVNGVLIAFLICLEIYRKTSWRRADL
jgi:hypothetical protein